MRRAPVKSHPVKASAADKTAPALASLQWTHVALTVVTVVLLSALMSVNLLPDRVSLHIGDINRHEIRASRTVFYVNTVKTQLNRDAAWQTVHPVYQRDEGAAANAVRIAQEFFDRLEAERNAISRRTPSATTALDHASANLQRDYSSFSRRQLHSLLIISPALLQKLRDIAVSQIRMSMLNDIHDKYDQSRPSSDLAHTQVDVTASAHAALSSENAAIVGNIARLALRPNLLFDAQKTQLAREAAFRQVPLVYEQISPGDKIIGAGERVTEEHLDKFKALGLVNPQIALETGIGVCILAAVMVLLAVYFIGRTLPKLYNDTRRLMLLALIVLISVFGLKIGGTLFGLSFSSGQIGYMGMMTVVAAGMLVSVLLDMQLAVLIVALLSVQSGLIMNHEIRFTVMTLMSSLVGIFAVGHVRRTANLPVITAALALANVAFVWLTGMIQRDSMPELLSGSIWAMGSGAFATFLYWFGILALERPFGILTHTALLELSAADRPLLRQLCTVAPGTYAHSMMVGSLAEAGAQAVGADALLCRVGGYYHDIGKMRRPDFFIENQRDGNVHGRLSPSLSALIITAHVRDGLEIAQEHRLPKEIRDIIGEHHGTTLIRYFYYQALTDCGGTDEAPPGLEERFRYPGPKPQARESAIVMLADSVEAAARCLHQPSRESLGRLINDIIRDKMEDGQFDECRLTFREVKLVTDAFLHVLTAMMHARIDYPKEFPKTASGRPMDLVRSDLRPDGMLATGQDTEDGSTLKDLPKSRPLLSNEVRYASLPDERTDAPGPHNTAETGSPPPPARSKAAERPGGYSPDR